MRASSGEERDEGKDQEWGEKDEIGGGAEVDGSEAGTRGVEQDEGGDAECAGGGGERDGGQVRGGGEDGGEGCEREHGGGDGCEATRGPAGGPMGVKARCGVLPCVEVEAVEGADAGEESGGGKELRTQGGEARDGGDEDGGGEEDADGEFFGETACLAGGDGAGVDEKHPDAEQRGEEDVEVERAGFDVVQEIDEGEGAEDDGGEEAAAVKVMEAVAGFEVGVVVGLMIEVCGRAQRRCERRGIRGRGGGLRV